MEDTSSAQQPLDLLTQLVPGGLTTLMLGLIFIAVMLGVLGAAALFGRDPVQRRLSGDAPRQSTKRKG